MRYCHTFPVWTEEQLRMPIFWTPQRQFQYHFRTLYDRVFRFCAMRIPSVEDRQDVTSETLLSAWERLGSFDGSRGELAGWVIGIARHKIADFWRKRHPIFDDDLLRDVPASESGEQTIKYIDDLLSFEQIMQSLTQDAKALLTLRHVDGLTHEEIAEVVNRTPAAVRQALSRLHRKLKHDFADYA